MGDSQADTQPANAVNSQSQTPEANSWAKLVFPFKPNPGCAWLKNEFSKFGKLPDCDILPNYIDPELLKTISKTHFVIQRRYVRGAAVAYIRDHSSNGTYVNGELIGKGKIRVLGNKDTISAVKKEFKICRFYYLSHGNQAVSTLPEQVKFDYHVMDLIATGNFNQVFYVLNKASGLPAVMKFAHNVSLNIHKDDGVLTELRLMQTVRHANIISYYNHILMDSNLYLFVEYMDGGDLNRFLRKKGKLSEPLARIITKQIIAGLEFLHSLKIAHKNIQPKNILLNSNENHPIVKLKNFRSCKKMKKSDASVKTIGTTIYDAPELKIGVHSRFDLRVDVWSFGVLLYVCLCGREPMEGRENNAGGLRFSPSNIWSQISPFARTVVEVCLRIDPQTRFHSPQISKLPWFIGDINQFRKRPNILTNNNSAPKRFKPNSC